MLPRGNRTGKIRIPKEILNEKGPLDPGEWEFVRRHTIEGEQMLRQVGGKLAEVASIVRASHERWDGVAIRMESLPKRYRSRRGSSRPVTRITR